MGRKERKRQAAAEHKRIELEKRRQRAQSDDVAQVQISTPAPTTVASNLTRSAGRWLRRLSLEATRYTSAIWRTFIPSPLLQDGPAEATPALGRLSRLPRELRDEVYDLTLVTFPSEEASITARCSYRPRSILELTSKTLRAEVTSSIDRPHVDRPQGWLCEHTHFTYLSEIAYTGPEAKDTPLWNGLPAMGHCFTNIRQLRIYGCAITGWITDIHLSRYPNCEVQSGRQRYDDPDLPLYLFMTYSHQCSKPSRHEIAVELAISQTIVRAGNTRADRRQERAGLEWLWDTWQENRANFCVRVIFGLLGFGMVIHDWTHGI